MLLIFAALLSIYISLVLSCANIKQDPAIHCESGYWSACIGTCARTCYNTKNYDPKKSCSTAESHYCKFQGCICSSGKAYNPLTKTCVPNDQCPPINQLPTINSLKPTQ